MKASSASKGILIAAAAVLAWHALPFNSETYAESIVKQNPLLHAAYRGDTAAVRAALAAGTSINSKDGEGKMAIHWVVYRGVGNQPYGDHVAALRALLEAGANPNARDTTGGSPLIEGSWNPEFVEVLLKAGAEVEARDMAGRTPLHSACYCGGEGCRKSLESVRLLLKAGADVNTRDASNTSVLATAAIYARPDIVRELIDAGADPRASTASDGNVLELIERYSRIEKEYEMLPDWLRRLFPGVRQYEEERRVSREMVAKALRAAR